MAMRKNKPLIIFLSLLALVIVLAGTSIYFYRKATHTPIPSTDTQAETKALVEAVGKVMRNLPNETPTIATVSDPSKLNNQVFFEDAQKGDKVLIYTDAKKAILFDPVQNKIVNVAPINLGANTPGTTQVTEPPTDQNTTPTP